MPKQPNTPGALKSFCPSKSEKENLSAGERKDLAKLVRLLVLAAGKH